MKIIIKGTSTIETLSLIDPKSGVDYISDFIGNSGALKNGEFQWDDVCDAYVCDQKTFDWWKPVVESNQSLNDRIHALVKTHGSERVFAVIHGEGSVDLEDHAASVNQALDDAFGSVE